MNVPTDLKYTKTHEWIRIDGDTATIGITDHAQSELGDIVFVEMPTVGRALQSGDTLGSVESVKTVSDIYAPVSGQVIAINEALGSQSELMNSEPYEAGWIAKIQLSNAAETAGLLDAATYQASLS